jgi:tight adherence protein B
MTTMMIMIFFAVVAGAIAVALVGSTALNWYQDEVVDDASSQLSVSFIFVDSRTLALMSVIGTVVLAGLGFFFLNIPGLVLGLIAGGVALPLTVRHLRQRRRDKFVYQLPDALRSMAGAMQAGATVIRAIQGVSERQGNPMAQEFTQVLSEYRMGRDLELSLLNLRKRIGCEELDLFNAAVQVSRSVGGNLAKSLESLAITLESKAQTEGKVRALTSMGRMQGWVLGLMPIFIGFSLFLQKPDEMRLLVETPVGWLVMLVAAVLMFAAMFTIRRIVNIDV